MLARRSSVSRRRGAAMVETALVLPVFLLLVLGIIEFGRALMVANMVTNAAREGARMAILDGSTNSQVQTAVEDFLTASLGVARNSITTNITIQAAPGNTNPGNQCANAQSRDLITVEVRIPFSKVALVEGDFLQGKNLIGRSAMRHE